MLAEPRFRVGQNVHHAKNDYRGVIIQADPTFAGTDEWYLGVAVSKPPRDQPWYRVLVDGATHETYVAERHLKLDPSGRPVEHPLLGLFFDHFDGGCYHCHRLLN